MTTAILTARHAPRDLAGKALASAAKLWLFVAVIGQWVFFYYIFALYGASTVTGHFEAWRRNHMLFKGYVSGQRAANVRRARELIGSAQDPDPAATASHTAAAAVVDPLLPEDPPCPCCGGRMRVIETFLQGRAPRTVRQTPIRIDTS